jgi:hypothetical protein
MIWPSAGFSVAADATELGARLKLRQVHDSIGDQIDHEESECNRKRPLLQPRDLSFECAYRILGVLVLGAHWVSQLMGNLTVSRCNSHKEQGLQRRSLLAFSVRDGIPARRAPSFAPNALHEGN